MNTKNLKRVVLGGSLVVLAAVFISENPLTFGFCKNVAMWGNGVKYCVGNNILPEYIRQIAGFLSLSFSFLSLLTYWAKDQLFTAWFKFAVWMVPVIVVATIWLNQVDSGSGLFSGMFTILVLSILYSIFIITSIVKIVKVHFALKWAEQGIAGDKLADLKKKNNKKIAWTIVILLVIWFVVGSFM